MNSITESEAIPVLDYAEFQSLYASLGRRAEQKLATLVVSFGESVPHLLTEIRQALAAGDRETLHRAAHTLKGTAAIMGAPALAQLARELEGLTREHIPPTAAEWPARLEAAYDQTRAALAVAQQDIGALKI